MQQTCPKCHAVFDAPKLPEQCPACGVYFAKLGSTPPPRVPQQRSSAEESSWRLGEWFGYVPDKVDSLSFYGRALLWLILLIWGGWFIAQDWQSAEVGQSFLHRPNLVFHEAGHVFFRPFGEFMMFLGGSLFQCLFPLIIAVVFLIKQRDPFAASVGLWWCGQNVIDVAPYIGDARALDLPLIGEWSEDMVEARILRHDWHNILDRLDALHWDHRLAGLARFIGATLIVLAWCWGGWLLWQQRRRLVNGFVNE